MSIMGNPKYELKDGVITLDQEDIHKLSADQRAQKGIFLAFQNIPEIEGLKLFEFLRSIYSNKISRQVPFLEFKSLIKELMDELKLDHEFLRRDLNV
ncbi:MAG: hypothetical protein GXP45_08630 [bacterium]|nr:hypothetical protein [bacterium]